ncbi:MAG: peptidoglycan-binding domain-containing protein [Magnetospirillum sp.]|nr:peptidoglycan-binding domain-containing protein [Magnetospirillum sp.]
MRLSAPIALAAALLIAVAAQAQSVNGGADPGHRFAPGLARIFVAEIQRQLAQRRYYDGPASGEVTPATRKAVAAFQHDVGLPVDGIADQSVIDMLNFGPKVSAGGAGGVVTAIAVPKIAVPKIVLPAVTTPSYPRNPIQRSFTGRTFTGPPAPEPVPAPPPGLVIAPAPEPLTAPAAGYGDEAPPPVAAPRPQVTADPRPADAPVAPDKPAPPPALPGGPAMAI